MSEEVFSSKTRQRHPGSFTYIIDKIMPAHTVHLIGGPSGAGKSSWILSTFMDWMGGKQRTVFGHKAYPCEWLYLSLDRTTEEVHQKCDSLGIDSDLIPIPAFDIKPEQDLLQYLIQVKAKHPGTKLFIVEGIQYFMPKGETFNDGCAVRRFVMKLKTWCKTNDCTIVGVTHTTKVREGEAFTDPRQRILGSVAWGGFCSLIIIVEPGEDFTGKHISKLLILPRETAPIEKTFGWCNGEFIELDPKKTFQQDTAKKFYIGVLTAFPASDSPNMIARTSDLRKWTGLESNNRAWEGFRDTLIAEGWITETKKGFYKIKQYDKTVVQKLAGMSQA